MQDVFRHESEEKEEWIVQEEHVVSQEERYVESVAQAQVEGKITDTKFEAKAI